YPYENPSLNRAGPAIPVVFALVGLPFAFVWRGLRREGPAARVFGLGALVLGAMVSIRENREAYFVRLRSAYDAVIEHSVEVAAALGQYRAKGVPLNQEYILGTAYWIDARCVAFELGDPGWTEAHNIAPPEVPAALTARPLVFVYRPN